MSQLDDYDELYQSLLELHSLCTLAQAPYGRRRPDVSISVRASPSVQRELTPIAENFKVYQSLLELHPLCNLDPRFQYLQIKMYQSLLDLRPLCN